MSLSTAQTVLAGALALVGLGLYALLTSQHLIKILVALQILVKGAVLALLAAGQISGQMNLAQALIIIVIAADTVVITCGLAFAVRVQRQLGTLDIRSLASLKG